MEKETVMKEIRYKDLPPHLKKKYKNSVLFEQENQIRAKKYDFDMKKLK